MKTLPSSLSVKTLLWSLCALSLAVATPAAAAVQTRVVDYQADDTALQGFLAWNDVEPGKRPGVLVVHEWWGHNAHARKQAERLVDAGYVAFALDMFGKGKVTTHPADAKQFVAEATADAARMRARFDAALAVLRADPHVDPDKIAVVGYCFGGKVALDMARSGADLDAVVALHAGLAPSVEAKPGAVKAKILVLTGGADPMVSTEQVRAFEAEMKAAGADARVITYPAAKHGFTNPDADKVGVPSLGYDPAADRASFQEMISFLRAALGA